MKNIILFITIFLLYTVSFTQSIISEAEKQKLVTGLENGDYSVLDPYLSREKLYPSRWLLNGRIVIKEYKEYRGNMPPITKPFTFKQGNKTLVYTNHYGFLFFEDETVLWDLEEIKSMPNAVCFGFYDMMKKAFSAKESEEIINLYNDYDSYIYDTQHLNFIGASVYPLISGLEIDESSDFNLSEAFTYVFNKVYPTKQQQKTFLLNFLFYSTSTRSDINASQECLLKNRIRIPYNDKINPYLRKDEEYECLFKE